MPVASSTRRLKDFAVVALAYAVAAAAAWTVADRLGPGRPCWQVIALADLAATFVVFAFSLALNNSSVYDPYWSVAPTVIAAVLAFGRHSVAPGVRRFAVLALVTVWGMRLTYNWGRGWLGIAHEDWRYENIRRQTGRAYWLVSLAGIHLAPTAWVYLGCLSLIPALRDGARPVGALDGLAALVTVGAIALETVADEQLRAFRRVRTAPGGIMDRGLWARSRHPNYLGEIMFWWGLYLFALAADPASWRVIVGPLAIQALFIFISIPMLDRRSLARRPSYAEHMARVPALFPARWRRTRRDED